MNVIKWVEHRFEIREKIRVPAAKLNQFEKDGYRICQHDEEFFVIERIKSGKIVYCESIVDAEVITTIAICCEKKMPFNPNEIKQSFLDKAYTLVGFIDVMYSGRNGDKVRRRTSKCQPKT